MKKIIAILAVVALTASCFASTITVSAVKVDNCTVQLNYVATGGVPVGASMNLSLDSGAATVAAVGDVNSGVTPALQVYVDYAYTNGTAGMNTYGVKAGAHPLASATAPGAKAFPASFPMALCMGNLGPNAAPASGTLAKIKLTVTTAGTLRIAADTAGRGGFVDAAGAVMTTNLPITVAFSPCGGCATCSGDVNGDNKRNLSDITALVALLAPRTVPPFTPPAYTIPSTDPSYSACGDLNSDGKNNLSDITALVALLAPRTVPPFTPPAYTIPCP